MEEFFLICDQCKLSKECKYKRNLITVQKRLNEEQKKKNRKNPVFVDCKDFAE